MASGSLTQSAGKLAAIGLLVILIAAALLVTLPIYRDAATRGNVAPVERAAKNLADRAALDLLHGSVEDVQKYLNESTGLRNYAFAEVRLDNAGVIYTRGKDPAAEQDPAVNLPGEVTRVWSVYRMKDGNNITVFAAAPVKDAAGRQIGRVYLVQERAISE
jgi:hypothetical protein